MHKRNPGRTRQGSTGAKDNPATSAEWPSDNSHSTTLSRPKKGKATVENCTHTRNKKSGLTASGTQRFRCLDCGKRFTTSTTTLDGMRIGTDKAAEVISLLAEGMG